MSMLNLSENIVTSIIINYINNYGKNYKNIIHVTLLFFFFLVNHVTLFKFYYHSIIKSMLYNIL